MLNLKLKKENSGPVWGERYRRTRAQAHHFRRIKYEKRSLFTHILIISLLISPFVVFGLLEWNWLAAPRLEPLATQPARRPVARLPVPPPTGWTLENGPTPRLERPASLPSPSAATATPMVVRPDLASLGLAHPWPTPPAASQGRLKVDGPSSPFGAVGPLNQADNLYFAETAHNLGGRFKQFWQEQAGLPLFGFPISEVFEEDGLSVQYFERARFEYHPESNQVELGLVGRLLTAPRLSARPWYFEPVAAFSDTPNDRYFEATGQVVQGQFKDYWEQNGGLAHFGYPLSHEFLEVDPANGLTYIVQYFERARFQWPLDPTPSTQVQLGLLGRELALARGWL